MLIYYGVTFFLGLCIGSFLNVVLFRLDKKAGIMNGRSECPHCLHKLAWYDLIPVVSYILLKGKCRYCRAGISYIYPLVELCTASAITSYLFLNGFKFDIIAIFSLFSIVLFEVLIFFDLLYFILPDKVVIPLGIAALFYDIFFRSAELRALLLPALIFSSVFAIIYLASRGRAMGFGDVKLVFVIGLILGYPAGFFSIIAAIWAAALLGITLVALKKANLKTALPFGSFLSASAILFIIFNKAIEESLNIYKYLF